MDTSTVALHKQYTRDELTDSAYYTAVFQYLKDKKIQSSIDAGACTGEYTKVLKEQIPTLNRCILIEPLQENVGYLKKHFDTVFPKVLMYGASTITLGVFHNVGGSSVFMNGSTSKTEVCETMTLEDIVEPIDFLKLDIEGMERNVIENSIKIQDIPYIEIEFHHYDEELQYKENRPAFLSKWFPNHHIVFNGADMDKESSIFISK